MSAALEQDIEYLELIQNLESLEAKTEQNHFLTFGQLINLDIIISKFALPNFAAKLSSNSLPELKAIGENLCLQISLPIKDWSAAMAIKFNEQRSPADEIIKIIDLDNSFENKLLFYHFFEQGDHDLSQIAEKLELLTVEQKEKIFEHIFLDPAAIRLPKIIFEHTFCSIELFTDFLSIQTAFNCPEVKIIIQPPSCRQSYPTPNYIFQTGLQPLFVETMERVKTYFTQTQNQYIIPFIFKQKAIIALNLLQLEIMRKQSFPLMNELLEKIHVHFHFIK